MGNSILITAFIIVIVGGMGSYLGSVIAAFVIAFVQTLAVVFVPQLTGYLIYLLMFAILLFRPEGILGTYEIREDLAKLSFSETIKPVSLTDGPVLAVLGVLVLVPLLPNWLFSSYYVGLVTLMFIWGLLALSLDIVMGYIGLISFGHAAFFGVGAYAVALTIAEVSNSFLLGVLVAVVATTAIAWVIGALSVRFSGVYFAMITFAAAQLLYEFAVSTPTVTGGSDGMSVTMPSVLGVVDVTDPAVLYYVALAVLVGSYYLALRVMDSPFGRVLTAVRESERRATFLGYDTDVYKRRAFALSGAIGGLSGVLFVTYQQFISPNTLYWFVSGDALFAMIFGGIGTLYGPIIGGAVLVGLERVLATYVQQWRLIVGVVLILIVMFAPRGLASILTELGRRLDGTGPWRPNPAEGADGSSPNPEDER
jgi:branched-chain amino acid transport system permease protein